jgi:hypothetical protein
MPQGVGTYGSQVGRPSKKTSVEDMQDVRKKVSSELKIRRDKDKDILSRGQVSGKTRIRWSDGSAVSVSRDKAKQAVKDSDEAQSRSTLKIIKRKKKIKKVATGLAGAVIGGAIGAKTADKSVKGLGMHGIRSAQGAGLGYSIATQGADMIENRRKKMKNVHKVNKNPKGKNR